MWFISTFGQKMETKVLYIKMIHEQLTIFTMAIIKKTFSL